MGGIIATLYLDNRIQSRAAMPIYVGCDVARAYKVDKKNMKKNMVDIKKLASMTPLDAIEYLGECGAYSEQASEFLRVTNSTLQVRYLRTGLYFGDTDENETRDIYEFRLSRGSREYVDTFGDSLQNTWERYSAHIVKADSYGSARHNFIAYYLQNRPTNTLIGTARTRKSWETQNEKLSTWEYAAEKPSEYSILAGMQAYEPPATFDEFVSDFGYDITSHDTYENAQRTFDAVRNQYAKLCTLYNDKELQALASIA